MTDPRRLKLIMRRHDPGVFPGEADCKPMACRNVALTGDNLVAWQQQLARLDKARSDDTLAPYLRHRLHQQLDDIARFIESTGSNA